MNLLRLSALSLLLSIWPAAHGADAPQPGTLTFLDSTIFDNMLSRELNRGSEEVEVAISGKMSLNNIPPRVDKWITAVAEKGEVTLLPVDASLKPKFVLALLPVVYSFLKQAHSERSMSSASDYNASLVYHIDKISGESVIDRIVFIKKKKE